jgi:hypothetical protein
MIKVSKTFANLKILPKKEKEKLDHQLPGQYLAYPWQVSSQFH